MTEINSTITAALAYVFHELGKVQFDGNLGNLKYNLKCLRDRVIEAHEIVDTEIEKTKNNRTT